MIGRIASLLLGNTTNEDVSESSDVEELFEFEEGEWVIINIQGESIDKVGLLENLLIEHPSMSVYNWRNQRNEEEEPGSEEEDEGAPRPAQVARSIPWRLMAWGYILEKNSHLRHVQRTRLWAQRRKLGRSHLRRQNQAKKRYSPKEKHYGNFKQPCQRIYNY
nr:PREDICTED: tumor protein p53-inducible nuclear protein 2-like [Lepisosteus oculatus]